MTGSAAHGRDGNSEERDLAGTDGPLPAGGGFGPNPVECKSVRI